MPHRSSVPASWRLQENRYSLVGTTCECGECHMPGRRVCECGNEKLESLEFCGLGEIVSYTTIHVAPAGFSGPYHIALIRLEEGPVVTGIVTGDDISVGKKVKSVFRRLYTDGQEGLITYGFKFELM